MYDESTKTIKNSPGVKTRVPGFGDTDTIEHLDSEHLVEYFAPMVKALASWGYERGVTVRAAPYDFRLGPGKFLLLLLPPPTLNFPLGLGPHGRTKEV